MTQFSLVIHGGAGTILKKNLTDELEAAYCQGLEAALDEGFRLLKDGASAMDSVLAATGSLEDNLLFNAGRGSVFAKDGSQEMDACVMDGKTGMAGAVAGVRNIRNPVQLAFAVMTSSPHVLLAGKGAYDFALSQGIKTEPDDYFFSQHRYDQWKLLQDSGGAELDHAVPPGENKSGTVGAVACDREGNLAAATSTGGMTNKQYGRIGDSPLVGAGTYASNHTCAISCTGHGEVFIRAVAAYDVSCLMEYRGFSLEEAMHFVIHDKLLKMDGEGGMIGVDAKGNTAMLFNSEGMYRGMQSSNGTKQVSIYK